MTFSEFLEQCRLRIDQALAQAVDTYTDHPRLQDAMRYSLFNGGKRVRPVLVYSSALAVSGNNTQPAVERAAVAIEAIHAYSLIHDDLPAMDNDDLRRGNPTCHIAFDEATAILAGDALQAMAFENIADTPPHIVKLLAQCSGAAGMVAGQSIDLEAVNHQLSIEALENMHRLKTGALIHCSVQIGALATEKASTEQLHALKHYTDAIGLAFQVQDDILDVTADTQTLGKTQGADAALSKPTYVSLLGLDAAREKARELHQTALDSLAGFDNNADPLRNLADYIVKRSY